MTSLFSDTDLTSARVPGLHSGQQELLILLTRLAGDRGHWTGSRAELAAALGCSVATVTRRKEKLVALGLVAAAPGGRVITYRILSTAMHRLSKPAPKPRSARRWFQRPDADQLEFDFGRIRCKTTSNIGIKRNI